jgi:flagellar L-ring protein FlgH
MLKTGRSQHLHILIVMIAIVLVIVTSSGCASLGQTIKGWMGDKDDQKQAKVTTPKYSDQENLRVSNDKQYHRMNRQKMEEDSDLKADAGSLWVMEGQGAYLFSQNQMRTVGDLLNVKIEGSPKSQLQTKVKVISKLLDRLENPPVRGLASATPAAPGAQPGATPAPGANGAQPAPAAGAEGAAPAEQAKADSSPFGVQVVPTRIVEQLKDGSYRVKGMQPFMIGKREYKVIVTGIVRSEDFDDAGIEASKLLDSQFDIVSSRKGAMAL